ncbi:GerMN domain-containing protein [Candidatus Uhrbacteria bacterium]|nr:GerMN domain-containing protein [Candidatus Uhrbacteria bacterium]
MRQLDTKTRLRVFGLIIAVAVAAAGLAYVVRERNLRTIAIREAPRPPETPTAVAPTGTEPTEPYPPIAELADPTGSIRVANIVPGQTFLNGTSVEGTAVAFENTFSWKLADADGRVLASGYEMAQQPDAGIPGPFAFPVFFGTVPTTKAGTLILFEASAKDGTPIHVLRIPVTFSQETETVKVYFGNEKMNPNAMDCSLVYPVERVVPKGTGAVAIHALLAGPTEAERRAGYYSSVPEGVLLKDASYVDGQWRLDFDQTLQEGVGGSCRVMAIRSQIEATAGAGARISIDGRIEDILQP